MHLRDTQTGKRRSGWRQSRHIRGKHENSFARINAWATWCPPCRAEMPDLNEFYQAHRAEGFTVLAINAGEDSATVSSFINEKGFTFPILLDPDTMTLSHLDIDSFPTSILVGRDGIIKTIHIGMLTPESLANEITPFIKQ